MKIIYNVENIGLLISMIYILGINLEHLGIYSLRKMFIIS